MSESEYTEPILLWRVFEYEVDNDEYIARGPIHDTPDNAQEAAIELLDDRRSAIFISAVGSDVLRLVRRAA